MDNGEIVRITAIHEISNSSQAQLVFTYEYNGVNANDSDVVDEIDGFFSNDWGPEWQSYASSDAELDRLDISVLNLDGTVNRVLPGVDLGLVGSNISPVLPPGVASLITAPTSLPKQRGKKYVPGTSEGRVDNGALNAAALGIMTTLAGFYLQDIGILALGDLQPGVLSRTLQQFVPLAGSAIVTNVLAYQRRRKPNVGI